MTSREARVVVLIPAYNEEECLPVLLDEVRRAAPEVDIVVINDGSHDRTGAVAATHGAAVLNLPCNLGVGGAVQAGFRFAYESGYDFAVRIDGDGQHEPTEIPHLLQALRTLDVDLVVGSRFLGEKSYTSSFTRTCGIRVLASFLSLICRQRTTDPTSGFQAMARPLLYFFGEYYPTDYPEPEALALMRRQGYAFAEVPARFRERIAGCSTIDAWGTLYYLLKVFPALLIDRLRPVDPGLSRERVVRYV